ncbi:MAG TPA: AAA family ATPase [Gemmatimonadaceae bacterium]
MIRLRSFGQCIIEVGDARLTPSAETLFATALYLVLEAGRPIERREIMDIIWADSTERRAHQCLRQTLYKLNAMGAALRSERTHVVLPHRSFHSDSSALLAAHERAELERLADTLQGPFLPGYAPHFSALFQDWLDRKRDIVTSALRRALVTGMNAKKGRGEWRMAELLAMRCLVLDPLNEEATLVLAEAAALSGSKVQALAILDRYLREIGPDAREIRLPAAVMRRRIAEVYHGDIVPIRQTPHVGRDSEMIELSRALSAAEKGEGGAFLIWGEPGIGKTRLVTEFTRGASLNQVQVARVGCQSHDERRPLSAFVDLVPRLLDLRGSVGCSPESMKYLKRLTSHDPTETALSPDSRESELLFSNIRRSLFDLLDAIAAEGRLIVVIEDVHWLDRMSWEILRDVVPWVATRQVVVLLTSRVPGMIRHFSDTEQAAPTQMHLLPLWEEASQELLRSVTAGTIREGNVEFHNWCVASAGGNPYYLTELAFHTSWDGEQYQAPATLGKLISERLDRLDPLSKRVLQACCILGKLSTLERLEHVLDENRVALLGALDELEALGLVESDGPTVFCKHELLAAAALARLSKLSAALLHRHAAQVLEDDVTDNQSTATLWECARHWQQAGERERAINLLRTCAHHSIEIGLPTEAVTLLDHALSLASGHEECLPLVEDLVQALHLADYWEKLPARIEMLGQLRHQAGRATETHTDDELLSLEAEWRTGSNVQGIYTHLQECVCADTSPEHRVRAAMLALMLADNICTSESAQSIYATVKPYLDAPEVGDITKANFNMVYSCSFGEVAMAPVFASELIKRARARGNAAILSRNLRHASIAFDVAGLTRQAETAAVEAFTIAEQLGLENAAIGAAARLVGLYTRLGQISAAEKWHRQAMTRRARFSGAIDFSNLIGFEAKLAIQQKCYHEAELLIDLANQKLKPGASLRHRAEITAHRISLSVARGDRSPTDDEIDELLGLHLQARQFVWHDYVAVVLFEALEARKEASRAAVLAREYIATYRRERSSLLPRLDRYLQSAGIPRESIRTQTDT